MMRAMCGVELRDRDNDLMLMSGMNYTINE